MAAKTRRCEICGAEIDPERVEVLPETRLCVEHGRAIAKFGGEFLVTATQDNLGKAGSLKKNLGDVTTKKHRNTAALEKLREEYERAGEGKG